MTTKHKALELADELENCKEYELLEYVHKTATMLRTIPSLEYQIELLKTEVSKWHQMYVDRAVK